LWNTSLALAALYFVLDFYFLLLLCWFPKKEKKQSKNRPKKKQEQQENCLGTSTYFQHIQFPSVLTPALILFGFMLLDFDGSFLL